MRSLKTTVSIDFLVFFAMFIAMFRPEVLPANVQIGLRIALLGITLVYLIFTTRIRDYFNAALPLSISIFLSSFINFKDGLLSYSNFLNGTLRALCIYCLYLMFHKIKEHKGAQVLLFYLHRILTLYFLISFISIFVFVRATNGLYFFGSKYTITYLLIFYSGVTYCLYEDRIKHNLQSRMFFISLYFIVALSIVSTGCMTGAVTYAVFFLLALSKDGVRKVLTKPHMVVLCMIGALLFLLLLQVILQNRLVQSFIVNVLHKDLTLTDRLRYYNRALYVIQNGNKYWGYGYASDLMRSNIALGTNLQNGLLQIIAEYGVITTIVLLLSAFYLTKNSFETSYWGIYMALYTFIIASMVEVSYSLVFYSVLFLVHILQKDKTFELQLKRMIAVH